MNTINKIVMAGVVAGLATAGWAGEAKTNAPVTFDAYLRQFDYAERNEMKIKTEELLELQRQGRVQVIDIRFPEEVALWRVSFAKSIPLNELPNRLDELDRDKLIVPVCPHYDRASIARHFLTLKGFHSRYLVEGLLGLTEALRGDKAKAFVEASDDSASANKAVK